MIRPHPLARPHRRGFALILVLVLVTLILGLWGVAGRHAATMLRIEQARANRARREATRGPALRALAVAAAALEVGYPPTSPYLASVLGGDGTPYTVQFERDPDDPRKWEVAVTPGDGSVAALDTTQFRPTPE